MSKYHIIDLLLVNVVYSVSQKYILWTPSLKGKCCGLQILEVNAMDSISF